MVNNLRSFECSELECNDNYKTVTNDNYMFILTAKIMRRNHFVLFSTSLM